jgi:hypothetical protein
MRTQAAKYKATPSNLTTAESLGLPDGTSNMRPNITFTFFPLYAIFSLFIAIPFHSSASTGSDALDAIRKHKSADLNLLSLTARLRKVVLEG